jgi:hypothetical protein
MLYQLSRMNDKDTFIERLDNLQQEIQTVIASRAVRAAPPR